MQEFFSPESAFLVSASWLILIRTHVVMYKFTLQYIARSRTVGLVCERVALSPANGNVLQV